MKKIFFITALIILVSLLICGCAQKKTEQGASPTPTATPAKTAASMPAPKSTVSSVTQTDLDKLKADIEKLEAEDLGGLSS